MFKLINKNQDLDKKGIFKLMTVALLLSVIAIAILGWQYRLLEKNRLPALEDKIEQNYAQDVLRRFLETRSDILLTERAMEQKNRGEFVLEEGVKYYQILKVEKLVEGQYRFSVQLGSLIEIIQVTKISGVYYIDSIETAG
jgi:hypothetical protein